MLRRLVLQRMSLSDLEWPFHIKDSRATAMKISTSSRKCNLRIPLYIASSSYYGSLCDGEYVSANIVVTTLCLINSL